MMHIKKLFFCFLLFTSCICLNAQENETILKYIETYKDIAMAEMQRTGVPAAITLAQGIHETSAGTSDLVLSSNNHFGIKCKSDWQGESVKHTDDAPNECFRKYESPVDSYKDHSDFLKNGTRYSFLFSLDPTDFEGWAKGLKKAGYATNPRYPQLLIKLINDYHLQDYTMVALGKMQESDIIYASANEQGDRKNNDNILEKAADKIKAVANQIKEDAEAINIKNYPEGEFKINNTRVVMAQAGTPYMAIAEKYNIDLSRLFEFNDMDEEEISSKDQPIYIQRKRKTGDGDVHIVKEGESLHDIAQSEGIRIESLLEYNMLTKYMQPAEGEILQLKPKSSSGR